MNLLLELIACYAKNLVVVKCQCRHLVEREPLGPCGIITAFHFPQAHQGIISNCYHSLTWITVRRCECVKLLDVSTIKPRLLLELAQCTFHCILVHAQESTWQRPLALERLNTTLNEQHFEFSSIKTKYHAVGSNSRMRILVTILQFFHF